MGEGGFYITLPCNASMNIYPDNRISNYKTRLARSMNLKGPWEVGLIKLYYPITWYTFDEEDTAFIINTAPNMLGYDEKHHKEVEGVIIYSKEKNLQNISKVCNTLKLGYYEDVLFLVREINANLPPRVTLGYDHVKNRIFLKAPLNTSLIFYGKLAIILGLKPGVSLGSVNQPRKDHSDDAPLMTYAPHQADIRGDFYSMYIYTDMIEYQSVGDLYVPLLRTVHIEGTSNDFVRVRFDKPHYAPVNKSNITDICIEVKDNQIKHVRFTYQAGNGLPWVCWRSCYVRGRYRRYFQSAFQNSATAVEKRF